jgi:hypothetical protein
MPGHRNTVTPTVPGRAAAAAPPRPHPPARRRQADQNTERFVELFRGQARSARATP